MRISRTGPKMEITSSPIHQIYDAQHLYTNIFHSGTRFYSILLQTQVSGYSQVYIYEMNSPSVVLSDAIKAAPPKENSGNADETRSLIPVLVALLGLSGIYLLYRRRHPALTSKDIRHPETETQVTTDDIQATHHYDFSSNSICFFGGFRVHDKDGEDITDLFTPTLKSLLILLVLYTCKDNKGISGNKLIQTLWFDKTEESAKNNRNVYMSKLRNILDRLSGVRILNQKGFWSISLEENAVCDYVEAGRLFAEMSESDDAIEKLVELLLKGVMLPNIEDDWVDSFKNEFSNKTIDFLTGLLKRPDFSDDFLLKIADTLFQHDFINEEALKVKCGILYRQGKKGLAKTVYDAFCKDYQSSLGTSFPVSMLDLIR